jgi:two-component system, NtrC family, sensor kinase
VLSRWPIRNKLLIGITLLVVIVGVLSAAGGLGVYRYRDLVRALELRAAELPLASRLSLEVSDLRAAAAGMAAEADHAERFQAALAGVRATFDDYCEQLERNEASEYRIDDGQRERESVHQIERILARLEALVADAAHAAHAADEQPASVAAPLAAELELLQHHTAQLPGYLHQRLGDLRNEVRGTYRTLIVLEWVAAVSAVVMLALLVKLFYGWVFRPLRVLIKGSRRVAAGEFQYRIQLHTNDEMSELAAAMNGMTERFCAIRDDLDRQVKLRTKQVVRSEQLASVGFLAAGVAHEINNPLASIALCAESLERRISDLLAEGDERHAVVRDYLRMIQEQAFRCKGITERLLDFSRMGDLQRHRTDLRELVQGVIDVVRHLGKYTNKNVQLLSGEPVFAQVDPQQIKQVVLNLVTNAMDSLDAGGTVTIALVRSGDQVELAVRDNGCGMTEDVLEHLFEPFFTRSRSGHGTGLGLSIAYSIIADHDGQIDASSDGPGRGSLLRVTIPIVAKRKEPSHRSQAA